MKGIQRAMLPKTWNGYLEPKDTTCHEQCVSQSKNLKPYRPHRANDSDLVTQLGLARQAELCGTTTSITSMIPHELRSFS